MNLSYIYMVIALCLMNVFLLPGYSLGANVVKVVDSSTKKPIKGAIVNIGNTVALTDENGTVVLNASVNKVAVRAYGYTRGEQAIANPNGSETFEIKLKPFQPKALYLSFYGIGDRKIRNSALKLLEGTELNTFVVDVKGDRGLINYKSSIALASEIGAQKIITVRDMNDMMKTLKGKGVYLIGRIVLFKDNLLAQAKPELALKTKDGKIWRDREGLAWVDPFNKAVWDYNIDIAVEAAKLGFDEIQFDYMRFPDKNKKNLKYSKPSTEENRTKAIDGFLQEARKRLEPYNVFVDADIFGYVCWNLDDTQIGQKIEGIVSHVDYVSPMLYPSGFQYGIPGYRNPVANPNKIVYLSLKRAFDRTHIPSNRFRPWLQAFRDYAYDRRYFKGEEVRAQINGAETFGSNGWMLWNPRNSYSQDGLKNKNLSSASMPDSKYPSKTKTINKEDNRSAKSGTAQAAPAIALQ